jgi:cAMP phosphodiesterase
MKLRILGGHGGVTRGHAATSFLIDDSLLLDAGSVAETLSIEEQSNINHILISHSHLDHIKDLAFLCDNCFGMKKIPFQVYTHQTVINIIMAHLFNDAIWPDFTSLPNKENPTIQFHSLIPEKTISLGKYKITPVKVQHPNDAMGYIIDDGVGAILFTVDTGPTERIWELAKTVKNLKAIVTEVSFPNSLSKVAMASDHHTPASLKNELEKMPKDIPIILTHLKPNFRDELFAEISALKEPRLRLLERDGELFNF